MTEFWKIWLKANEIERIIMIEKLLSESLMPAKESILETALIGESVWKSICRIMNSYFEDLERTIRNESS